MEASQPVRGGFTCSFTTRACSHAPIFASQYKRYRPWLAANAFSSAAPLALRSPGAGLGFWARPHLNHGSDVLCVNLCVCLHDRCLRSIPNESALQRGRTNRTKGLKIMRCFPHCCPRHMSRSYCGAPVYLQVDWEGPPDADGSKGISPVDEQRLKVVARFRTRERGSLSVGQDVPSSVITSATPQEATDSEVDWVSARLIASANRNSWLFEINKLARWFYRWEVGPTRERRFKPHVFEAYLFYDLDPQPPPQRTSSVDGGHWRVLAVACSPNFTLVSSRRARDGGAAQLDDADDELDENPDGDDESRESMDESLSANQFQVAQASHLQQIPPNQGRLAFAVGSSGEAVQPRTISQQFAVFSWFVDQLPLTSLLLYVSRMEKNFTMALLDELQAPSMAEIIQRKRHDSSSSAMVLSRLLVNAATPLTKPLPTTTPPPYQNIAPKSIQQVIQLVMWLFFDKIMGKQMNRFLQRASRTLLNKTELYESSLAWLQWLRDQMDGMLASQESSTEQLIHGLCAHYAASPRSAAKIRWLCASSNHEAVDRIARQAFVAHVREVHLSTAPLSVNAQLARNRLQPLPLTSSSPSVWSGYTGTWLCTLEDVALQGASRTTNPRNSVPGASVLLWFWRQLSCVSLTITSEESTPALLLSSVFNRSASDNLLSRLVLDNQPRWFRCLPSGESTIAVPLGGQIFGDYIAWFNTDDCINVQTYSWPSKSLTSAAACAYCWQWQIALFDRSSLRVDVKIERGRFNRGQASSSAAEDEDHLGTKLEGIDAWEPAYELQLMYTRLS